MRASSKRAPAEDWRALAFDASWTARGNAHLLDAALGYTIYATVFYDNAPAEGFTAIPN